MKYRTLGTTNLRVSVIGIGTWQFGGEWGKNFAQDEVDRMFDKARDRGINLIDTAECYGDHTSEALIGRAIARDRDKWIIATKFGHKFHGYMDRTEPRKPSDVIEQVESSLKALRTDHVDLLQYHSWGDEQFFDDDVLKTVHDLKKAGKVKHLGNSVGKNNNLRQIDASSERDLEVIQIIYNRLDLTPETSGVFDSCIRQNLGVLARVPLASGFLSGKYRPGTHFEKGDVCAAAGTRGRSTRSFAKSKKFALPRSLPARAWPSGRWRGA
jgi:aryl-alcohol dehydrogenase-like predicted oxidoreductase